MRGVRGRVRAAFWVACALVVAGLAVQLLACGGVKPPAIGGGKAEAPAPAEADNWTHKELADHLTKHGLEVRVEDGRPANVFGPASATLRLPDGYGARVTLEETPQKAREAAGTLGGGAFAWGRFSVEADEGHAAVVRTALAGGDAGPGLADLLRRAEERDAETQRAIREQDERDRLEQERQRRVREEAERNNGGGGQPKPPRQPPR